MINILAFHSSFAYIMLLQQYPTNTFYAIYSTHYTNKEIVF